VIFAAIVTLAVVLGIRELHKAFHAIEINIPLWSLATASIALCAATWFGGVSGLTVATAIAFPCLLVLLLPRGTENFVRTASAYNSCSYLSAVPCRISHSPCLVHTTALSA